MRLGFVAERIHDLWCDESSIPSLRQQPVHCCVCAQCALAALAHYGRNSKARGRL
jgi:hypothetical protein